MGVLNPFGEYLFLPSALCFLSQRKAKRAWLKREVQYKLLSPPPSRILPFSTLSSVMVAPLTFFFLRLGDLALTLIFLYVSQLRALQGQNFWFKWHNLPKLCHSPKTDRYLIVKLNNQPPVVSWNTPCRWAVFPDNWVKLFISRTCIARYSQTTGVTYIGGHRRCSQALNKCHWYKQWEVGECGKEYINLGSSWLLLLIAFFIIWWNQNWSLKWFFL